MKKSLISIVIPTKNAGKTLGNCLESIRCQDYKNHEVIIVDACSPDRTKEIATAFGAKFLTYTGSLPAARNLGYSKARGEIFVSIDADMVLEQGLLRDIAEKTMEHSILIIPEVGCGDDFLSKCKDLEKRSYVGDELVECARVFTREAFSSVGGYDKNLWFGEDWDIHWRLKQKFSPGRTSRQVLHDTGNLSMAEELRKAYLYGKTLPSSSQKAMQKAGNGRRRPNSSSYASQAC